MRFVVIGGGIAGVCCAQELARLSKLEQDARTQHRDNSSISLQHSITLLTAHPVVPIPVRVANHTAHLSTFELEPTTLAEFAQSHGVDVQQAQVTGIDVTNRCVLTSDGRRFVYDRVCIATGAHPAPLPLAANLSGSAVPYAVTTAADAAVAASSAAKANADVNDRILFIRDANSIVHLNERLASNSKGDIAIIGNGGIALELVYKLLQQTHASSSATSPPRRLHWLIKDRFVGHAFFDHTAAAFLMPQLFPQQDPQLQPLLEAASRNSQADEAQSHPFLSVHQINPISRPTLGGSLGPFWMSLIKTSTSSAALSSSSSPSSAILPSSDVYSVASNASSLSSNHHIVHMQPAPAPFYSIHEQSNSDSTLEQHTSKNQFSVFELHLHTNVEVTSAAIEPSSSALSIHLSNESELHVDFAVSAIGVVPCIPFAIDQLAKDDEGALLVDCSMKTSVADIFAAGDCCSVQRPIRHGCDDDGQLMSPNWHQMRLWTQARTQGIYAAQCMLDINDELMKGWPFQIFAHATEFLGHKVVLLGSTFRDDLDSAADDQPEIQMRVQPQHSYAKLLLRRNRLVGAVLIGETDLDETCENLILNEINLSMFGGNLLDPDVDLEDYFD